MNVKVEIELAQMPTAQSKQEIYNVAEQLTDNTDSISISMSRKDTPIVIAEFTIPPARQIDVVDGIGRSFWVIEQTHPKTSPKY